MIGSLLCVYPRLLGLLQEYFIWGDRLAPAALIGILTVVWPSVSVAATPKLCIPNATGVPYWSEAPNWWDPLTDPGRERLSKSFSRELRRTEDPRWNGALSIGYSLGGPDSAEFRALHNPFEGTLLLSWSVKSMNFIAGQTSVVVGLQLGSGTPEIVLVRIEKTTTEVSGEIIARQSEEVINTTPTTFLSFSPFDANGASTNLPGWATDKTRVWIKPKTSMEEAAFTLQMRVAIPAGTSDFRMWYSMQPSVPLNGEPGLAAFTWPRGPTLDWSYYDDLLAGKHIPAVNTWGEFHIGAVAGCAGISLADTDIGVKNSQFPAIRDRISITSPNIFYALPKNETGVIADVCSLDTTEPDQTKRKCRVKATFYFANWGSQRGDLTDSSWRTLTPQLVQRPVIKLTSVSDIDTNVSMDPTAVPSNGKAQIAPTWSLSTTEACRFFVEGSNPLRYLAEEPPNGTNNKCVGMPPPDLNPHGCMLVKLNGPLEFLKDSALRNMDFAKASTVSRQAEIRSGPGSRNVYLLVDRRNMPRQSRPNPESPYRATPIEIGKEQQDIQSLLIKNIVPPMSYEELAAVMPTYAVHAFAESGRKVLIDGVPHIALDQQTSFGFFLYHEGPLYGWTDAALNAPVLRPDVYRVTVPDGGKVDVVTRITAIEEAALGRRYALSLAAGRSNPLGSFNTSHDGGVATSVGIEYALNPNISVEGTLGLHQFEGGSTAGNIDVTQFGIGGKWYLAVSKVRAFLTGGIGGYAFDPGSTRFGFNAGLGVQYDVASRWSIEGRYSFNAVQSNSPNSEYSTVLVGARYAF